MHAVGESFNCCGRNKGKDTTKSKNALALMQNNMKRVDIFGYDEPAYRHSSSIGGCLTILAGLFVLQGFIQLVFNAVEGQIQINRDIKPINEIKIDKHTFEATGEWPDISFKTPKLFISPDNSIGEKPFMYNPAYYTVVANHVTIYESEQCDENHKYYSNDCEKKVKLSPTKCSLKRHSNERYGYCLDSEEVVGTYEDVVYTAVEITILPCHFYPSSSKQKCAPTEVIEDIFWKNYSSISLWVNEQTGPEHLSGKRDVWFSRVYTNFRVKQWVGVEVYFQPNSYTRKDFFEIGNVSNNVKFSMYEKHTVRVGVKPYKHSRGFMKFYVRSSSSAIEETGVISTWTTFYSAFGGMISFAAFFFGKIAVLYNYSSSLGQKQMDVIKSKLSSLRRAKVTPMKLEKKPSLTSKLFAKEKFDEELLQKQIVNERRQSTIRLEKRRMEIQRMKINNEKNLVDDGRDDK